MSGKLFAIMRLQQRISQSEQTRKDCRQFPFAFPFTSAPHSLRKNPLVIITDKNSFSFNDCTIAFSLLADLHTEKFSLHSQIFSVFYTQCDCLCTSFFASLILNSLFNPLKIRFSNQHNDVLWRMNICHSNAHLHKELPSTPHSSKSH